MLSSFLLHPAAYIVFDSPFHPLFFLLALKSFSGFPARADGQKLLRVMQYHASLEKGEKKASP
jgi:hypothetical protein